MTTNKKNAVIYCRVSTKEQVDEGNSLKTQQKNCIDFAMKNQYEVVNVYIEQGESAKTADRTELKKMLHFCAQRKNNVDAVIVYKLDRLSRNIDDYSQIRILLKRYSVEIKSVSEFFEDNPAGRFMENIIANVAQFDNDVRTERSIGGMKEAVREGRYVWQAPVGYSNSKINGKSNIVPNEKSLLVIKLFEEVAKGLYSPEEIRVKYFSNNIITNKNKPISRSYYYTLLKNEVYAGWLNKFGERNKGVFDPIISEDLFRKVQSILNNRKRKIHEYKSANPDFPLRRFVRSTENIPLTGGWSKGRVRKYPYYRFLKTVSSIKKETLEIQFIEFMNSFRFDVAKLKAFKKTLNEKFTKYTKEALLDKSKIENEIVKLNDKQTALIQKNLDGIIPDALLQMQLYNIQNEIDHKQKLLTTDTQKPNIIKLLNFAEEYLKNPGNIWNKLSFEKKIKLQWFNFPSGVIYDGNKFRTTEVCSLFNTKNQFHSDASYLVHHQVSGLNTLKSINIPYSKSNNIVQSKYNSQVERYVSELSSLFSILTEQ